MASVRFVAICQMCEEELESRVEGISLIIEPCPQCASEQYPAGVTVTSEVVD